jgi:predicted hydrocarbon binding protein
VLVAGTVSVSLDPFELRALDALTARVGRSGSACRLYGALVAGLVELHGARTQNTVHVECQARGDEACVWRIEPPAQ